MKSFLRLPARLAHSAPAKQRTPLCPKYLKGAPQRLTARAFASSSSNSYSAPSTTQSQTLTAHNPRWLSNLKVRVGKCIMFGMDSKQTAEASSILKELAKDWRELVAGSEGYLTSQERLGLYRHRVVWGDMYGHVNNVTYNKYAESARIEWAHKISTFVDPERGPEWRELWTSKGVGLILRSIKTEYKFPMTFPDHVSVYHKLRHAPDEKMDHFILDVIILSELHQRPAARCVEDIVVYDYKKGKKAPLRPFMVDMFKETFRLQEEAKKTNGERIRKLHERVEALERETWDRPDAREDVGSAAS